MPRILHLLSQRPGRTGSGVTLDALLRQASRDGHIQQVVLGTPASDPQPRVGGLPGRALHPLRFETEELPFALPGMSDVMPYPSSRFSALSASELSQYRAAWRSLLVPLLREFRPQLLHSHHVWLLSALCHELAPELPMVVHCHATGLRQLKLCPHLAPELRRSLSTVPGFVVLHQGHGAELQDALGVPGERIHQVGAGYREDIFSLGPGLEAERGRRVAYVGKYAAAKGLPWLLDALTLLSSEHPDWGLELHVAGGGAGPEAQALGARMNSLPWVRQHGMLSQPELAALLRRCHTLALPSLYEGVPLVLVEALACGCRLVSTLLPGVVDQLAPELGGALEMVSLPSLVSVDRPEPAALPGFVRALSAALERSLSRPALSRDAPERAALPRFGWARVYERVSAVWQGLL